MTDSIFDIELKKALNIYTQEVADRQEDVKRRVMDHLPHKTKSLKKVRLQRSIAVLASFALIFSFFAFTPAGKASAAAIAEGIEKSIEWIFPTKEVSVAPEGMPEDITHVPHVVEPEEDGLSGFVIYVDESRYETIEEDGTFEIWDKQADVSELYTREEILADMGHLWEGLSEEEIQQKIDERLAELEEIYSGMPDCKIEIVQVSDMSYQEAAEKTFAELQTAYPEVWDITESELVDGLYLFAAEGSERDSEIKEIHFVDNHKGGTFIITSQYFMEATEGHGERFAAMIRTFEVLTEITEAD